MEQEYPGKRKSTSVFAMIKIVCIIVWLSLLFCAVAMLFWHNELVYALPTPVPQNYKVVDNDKTIDVPAKLRLNNSKPLFLHFFNPACPCSRFNIEHFRFIVKQYEHEVNFAIVVLSNSEYSVKEIQDKLGMPLPVFFDSAIAARCGVYSTPQAVILDTARKLFYRGNYNRTRYCTDERTEYARLALNDLLHDDRVSLSPFALKAYGCKLPKCAK